MASGGRHSGLARHRHVYMRWKERFFVEGCECRLTIAGFYYLCLDRCGHVWEGPGGCGGAVMSYNRSGVCRAGGIVVPPHCFCCSREGLLGMPLCSCVCLEAIVPSLRIPSPTSVKVTPILQAKREAFYLTLPFLLPSSG